MFRTDLRTLSHGVTAHGRVCGTKLGFMMHTLFKILSEWVDLNSDYWDAGKYDLTSRYSSCHLITLEKWEEDIKIIQFRYKYESSLMWLSRRGSGEGEGERAQFFITLFLLKVTYPTGSHWQRNERQKILPFWSKFWRIWLGPCYTARYSIFAKGPAIMINVICLNHYSPPWFGKHYGDGMVINDRRILFLLWPLFICHLCIVSSIFLNLSESPKGTGCLFVFQ